MIENSLLIMGQNKLLLFIYFSGFIYDGIVHSRAVFRDLFLVCSAFRTTPRHVNGKKTEN